MHSRWLSRPKRDFVAPDSGRTIRSLSGQEQTFEGRCYERMKPGFHASLLAGYESAPCILYRRLSAFMS